MKGDYGTMHIELGPDVTDADADWLNDKVAGIVFEKRRFRGKDIMVSLHTDGDCQASPHCFGAERRRLAKELRAKATSRFDEHGPLDARGAAIWDVANWLTEADHSEVDA